VQNFLKAIRGGRGRRRRNWIGLRRAWRRRRRRRAYFYLTRIYCETPRGDEEI
jgi:hypothetical protein